MFRLIFFLALLNVIVSCARHSKSISTGIAKDEKENPYQILGMNLDSAVNESGKFKLFVQKRQLTDRYPVTKAIVIETTNRKVLAQFSFTPGYIKWISEDEVEIYDAPGMITKDEEISKFIRKVKIKPNTHTP